LKVFFNAQSSSLAEVVYTGVKGIPKDDNGTVDPPADEALKLDSTPARIQDSKKAFAFILQALEGTAFSVLSNCNESNPFEALKILKANFGITHTAEEQAAAYSQLLNIKKTSSETMTEFIVRLNTLIGKNKELGNAINDAARRIHLLTGAKRQDDWWAAKVEMITTAGSEWTIARLEQALIAADNLRRSETAGDRQDTAAAARHDDDDCDDEYNNDDDDNDDGNDEPDSAHASWRGSRRGGRGYRGARGGYRGGRGGYRGGGSRQYGDNRRGYGDGGRRYGDSNRSYDDRRDRDGERNKRSRDDDRERHTRHDEYGGNRSQRDDGRSRPARSGTRDDDGDRARRCYRCGGIGHQVAECPSKDTRTHAHNTHDDDNGYVYDEYDYDDPDAPTPKRERANIVTHTILAPATASAASSSSSSSPSSSVSAFTSSTARGSAQWVLDGACTKHLTGDASLLTDLHRIDKAYTIHTPNHQTLCDREGTAILHLPNNQIIRLNHVGFVKEFQVNLMSVTKLTDNGATVTYNKDCASIVWHGGSTITVPRVHNLWELTSYARAATNTPRQRSNNASAAAHVRVDDDDGDDQL
jgi:hypothetical protein